MKSKKPTPAQIRAARTKAGLTQTQAASLIGKSLRAWQMWECDVGLVSHRGMDAALYEFWKIKASAL